MTSYDQADTTLQDATGIPATDDGDEDRKIETISLAHNIAKDLEDDTVNKIGSVCREGFESDHNSRRQWEEKIRDWEKLALQVQEEKSWPWPGAANVKYPLLATAAIQFAARAYPSLIPSNKKIVQSQVIGKDLDGSKQDKADRVSTYMSYQVMDQLKYWEEEMDKLLIMLPIVGCMFKKTYFNKEDDVIDSKLILPRNIVVNYWTKRIEDSERVSEIIQLSKRALKEKQLQGIYLDIDLGEPLPPKQYDDEQDVPSNDIFTPYEIIEQHTFYDIDDDGYQEPVIVSFERQSGKVLRISNRYHLDDVERNDKDEITKINPICMYTKFSFIPAADGCFYDVGFGNLLGPLNESVNTLLNQLIDSGTLHNLNAGFLGKSLRLRQGDTSFIPGEWKPVNSMGDDLRKQVVPLPAKEPSAVLVDLLKYLVTAGKELASVAEIFTGKMPGQNTPATTTMATVEQGMKVFTAVYKRIFRSLNEEFYKIFCLNGLYLDPNKYVTVLDTTVGPDDFDKNSVDICPSADPNAVTQNEKLQKAQGLAELMQMFPGVLDPIQVVTRILEAQEQPNYQKLFTQQVQQSGQMPPPPPDPKVQALQMKSQMDQQKFQLDAAASQQKAELESRSAEQQLAMKAQEHAQEMQFAQQKNIVDSASHLEQARFKIAAAQASGAQKLDHAQQSHEQKLQQTKESTKLTSTKHK